MTRRLPLALGTVGLALALTGCGDAADTSGQGTASAGSAAGLDVVASFYPLQYLAEQVGGDRVRVTGLTPPGAEPHDLELTPRSLAELTGADEVLTLGGFQPAVDQALAGSDVPRLDLSSLAGRSLPDGEQDPHFWNDPSLMAQAATLTAESFTEADPDGAATYRANAEQVVGELTALDEEADAALASCRITTLVTAHDAFGYFADRYGFEVRPVNGVSPDQEPSARTLAEISDLVRSEGITTVYTETLAPTAVADTVAAESGARTAVLDPLEGLTDDSAGQDYPSVMRANIDTVTAGQQCT